MECQELKCCICDEEYSDAQIPRNLRCGHSVCSMCVDLLIPISKRCPECRDNFVENNASELPINYPLLRLSRIFVHEKISLKNLPELKFPINYSSSKPQQQAGKCPAHGCSMYFMCMRCGVWVCRDCLVVDHPDSPRGRCFILSIEEAISKIKKSHISSIDRYVVESNEVKNKLESNIRILNATLKYCVHSHNEIDSENFEIQEIRKLNENMVNRLSTLNNISKSLNEAKDRLSNANSPKEISKSVEISTECQSNYENYIAKEKAKECPNILKSLLGGKNMKQVVEGEQPVYVVTEKEETVRWASVTLKGDCLHLNSLRDGIPPNGGVLVPFELVRGLVPIESPTVFLEVGWGGEIKGHVYVRMFGNTPRSRQTTFLCSGEKGPSYRNTCFYESAKEADGAHLLRGGDYENNDGTGGRAIVDDIISGGCYLHEVKAGLFVSWSFREQWRLGSFDVYLNDVPGLHDYSAHGIVEKGLEILKEAAEIMPVTDATVMDCGLVIPS